MKGPLEPPGAPTGSRIEFHGADHWEFRDGLLCRCEALYDLNAIGLQIGAVPPQGSTGERIAVWMQRRNARGMRRHQKRGANRNAWPDRRPGLKRSGNCAPTSLTSAGLERMPAPRLGEGGQRAR
jgi:hypothetical protein